MDDMAELKIQEATDAAMKSLATQGMDWQQRERLRAEVRKGIAAAYAFIRSPEFALESSSSFYLGTRQYPVFRESM